MNVETSRFGVLEVSEADLVTVPEGMLGFAGVRRFVRVPQGEGSPFVWLQSAERPDLAFLLLPPRFAFPDYAPRLPADAGTSVWAIVTVPGGRPQDMTANLLGPVVIDEERRVGRQVVLESDNYTTRHRVFPAASPPASGVAAVPPGAAPAVKG